MRKSFYGHSVSIENDIATVTGDAKQAHQVEALWFALNEYCKATEIAETPYQLQDWVRDNKSSQKALELFSIQQRELQRILQKITREVINGDALSTDSIEQLAGYSTYQLAVQIMFEIDAFEVGATVQYLIDEQRKNPKLTVYNTHCEDCGVVLDESNCASNVEVLH